MSIQPPRYCAQCEEQQYPSCLVARSSYEHECYGQWVDDCEGERVAEDVVFRDCMVLSLFTCAATRSSGTL